MIVKGAVKLRAPIEKVWSFIIDPEKLATVIPGCESVKVIDEKTYESELKVRVGIFRFRFSGTSRITEIHPLNFVRSITEGKDRVTGTKIILKTAANLQNISGRDSEDQTEITYVIEVNIVGTLANFGETVMRAKGEQIRKEFEENLVKFITP